MHLAAAFHQQGDAWREGTALYYILHQGAWVTRAGNWLLAHVSLSSIEQLSFAYRWAEIVIGCLVLVPFVYARRLAIALLLLFHLASRALWNIGLYDWIVLGALPLLLSTHDWDALSRWYARRKPRLTVYFDADCGVCLAICRFLKRLDGLSRLTFVAGASDEAPADVRALASETVVVQGENGGPLLVKARAVSAIIASLPFLSPVAWALRAPGLTKLAERAYDRFAQNRAAISVFFGYEACGVRHAKEEPRVTVGKTSAPWSVWGREIAAGLFLLLCSAALLRGTEDLPVATGLESSLQTAIAYPRIFQQWNLFAPEPPRRQGVVIVEGLTSQGHHVDPLTGSEPSADVDPARLATLSPYMAAYFREHQPPLTCDVPRRSTRAHQAPR